MKSALLAVAIATLGCAGGPPPPVETPDPPPIQPSPAPVPAPPIDVERHPIGRAQELLADVAPFVERACGAKFSSPPRVVALTASSAAAVFAEDMRPEFDRRYAHLPPSQRENLLKLAATTSVRSCLARYSFDTKHIVVVREGFDLQCAALKVEGERAEHLLRVSLAHECVHALDDARFDLAKLYRGAADDEALRAVAMVAEGRAVHFGRVAAAATGAPQDLVDLLPGGPSPRTEREWHANLTYRLGARFVGEVVARGGAALADRAMASPPASTWFVCVASRWPDGRVDDRPAATMSRAGLADDAKPLSELQLRERYCAMKGFDATEALFERFTGGSQSLVGGTNAAILAFADEDSAARFEAVSGEEAPTRRAGTIVVRAIGESQDAMVRALADAVAPPPR
jgi:hypothetical protein